MIRKINYKLIAAIVAALVMALSFAAGLYAAVTTTVINKPTGLSENFTFFNATTTSATSTNTNLSTDVNGFKIAGAKKVDVYFTRGDTNGQGNVGTSTFRVQVTPDGANWYDFNKLIPNAATSTTPTRFASVQMPLSGPPATSTVMYSLDLQHNTFQAMRVIVVEQVDGQHTAKAYAEF